MRKRNIIIVEFIILSFLIGSLISIPEDITIAGIVIVGFLILHGFKPFLFGIAGKKKGGR